MKKLLALLAFSFLACSSESSSRQTGGTNLPTSELKELLIPMNVTLIESTNSGAQERNGFRVSRENALHLVHGRTYIRIPVSVYTVSQYRHWDCVLVQYDRRAFVEWTLSGKIDGELCRIVNR